MDANEREIPTELRSAFDALRIHVAAVEQREKNAHDAAAYWRTRARDAEEELGRITLRLLVAGTLLGGVGATLLWVAGFWIAMR